MSRDMLPTDWLRRWAFVAVLGIVVLTSATALAQQNPTVPVQGFLTDSEDVPVDDTVSVVFTLYGDDGGGNLAEVWTTTRDVPVEAGLFSVMLGTDTPLDLALFADNQRILLGIAVDGDTEMPLVELGAAPYAGWAAYAGSAGDAETLNGRTAAELESDTLSNLTCSSGDVALYDEASSAWICGAALSADDVDQQIDQELTARGYAESSSLAAVATTGDFADLNGVPSGLADGDDDTLGGIACAPGQVVKQGAGGWSCGDDLTQMLMASTPLSIANGIISLTPGGIDSTYLADGSVTNAKVASNAAISPSKIAGVAATLTGTQNFDNDTFVVNASSNRVGVGTPNPTQALSVSGNVAVTGSVNASSASVVGDAQASSFSYPSPQTRTISITGASFEVPENEDDRMQRSASGGYTYSESNPDTIFIADLYAPLALPDGALITALRCVFYDSNSTYDLNSSRVYLRSRAVTSSFGSSIDSVVMSSTGSSTTPQVATATGINEVVDNSTNQYWLSASWSIPQDAVGNSSIRFYGCYVDYTVDGPG